MNEALEERILSIMKHKGKPEALIELETHIMRVY